MNEKGNPVKHWIVAGCLLVASSAALAEDSILVNGKDLTGWTGDSKLWSV